MDTKKCCKCEHQPPPNERTENNSGRTYCDECYYEDYFHCECCECESLMDNATMINDQIICNQCVDLHYKKCTDCHEFSHMSECIVTDDTGNVFCDSDCLFNHDGGYCYNCDKPNELINYDNENEDAECNSCSDERNHNAKIRAYSYKPNPIFFVGKNEKAYNNNNANERRLVFGFELEVENVEREFSNSKCVEFLNELFPELLYFKNDCSINNGFEIVSHPMTYQYYKENKSKFSQLLAKCVEIGLRSYDTSTCGLHISLSRKAFTESTYLKFVNFFNNTSNHPLLKKVSQRVNYHYCEISKFANRNQQIKFSKVKKRGQLSTERYQALNLQNEPTLEIRLFRGTLKPHSFFKAFECVFAIYDYCLQMGFAHLEINKKRQLTDYERQLVKQNDGTQIANISKSLIAKNYFNTFIHKNKKQYKSLDNFLTNRFGSSYNCGKDESKIVELNRILNQRKGGYNICV